MPGVVAKEYRHSALQKRRWRREREWPDNEPIAAYPSRSARLDLTFGKPAGNGEVEFDGVLHLMHDSRVSDVVQFMGPRWYEGEWKNGRGTGEFRSTDTPMQ
jgi:hypothetical protein